MAKSRKISAALIDRVVAAITARTPILGAQAIGWRLLHDAAFEDAQEGVAQSVDWKPTVEWKPTEVGVVGLAVVATRLKQNSALKDGQKRFQKDFPALADFKGYEPPTAARFASPVGGRQEQRSAGQASRAFGWR